MTEDIIYKLQRQLEMLRIKLEQVEQDLNIACAEGTREQINRADDVFRRTLDECFEVENQISNYWKLRLMGMMNGGTA